MINEQQQQRKEAQKTAQTARREQLHVVFCLIGYWNARQHCFADDTESAHICYVCVVVAEKMIKNPSRIVWWILKLSSTEDNNAQFPRVILLIIAGELKCSIKQKRVKYSPEKKNIHNINMHFTGIYRMNSNFGPLLPDHHIILLAQKSQNKKEKLFSQNKRRKANI